MSKRGAATGSPDAKRLSPALAALAVLLTLAALAPILGNDFVNLDDPAYVVHNPVVRSLSPGNVAEAFQRTFLGNYQPLTIVAYALVYALFGPAPAAFHAASLLVHGANVLLVYSIAFLLCRRSFAAFVAAALFGVHPLHVESVAWASALKDVLYTFFFLLALRWYTLYVLASKPRHYALALGAFLLSLLCKGQAVVLPVVFLLVDAWLRRPPSKKTIVEKAPFFALALGFGFAALWAQQSSGAVQAFAYYSLPQRLLFACYGLVQYGMRLVFPVDLSCFYPYPETGGRIASWLVYAAPLIVLACAAVIWMRRRAWRGLALGALFFLLTILPVLQLVPVGDAVIADRYTYVPAIGFMLAAGCALQALLRAKPGMRNVVIAGTAMALVALSAGSFARARVWKDSITLFDDALSKAPVPLLYSNRGAVYDNRGEHERAVADFTEVVRLEPRYPNGYRNLGVALRKLGKEADAAAAFTNGLATYPGDEAMRLGRAAANAKLGRTEEALADLDAVLAVKPDLVEARANRGMLLMMKGEPARAIDDFGAALRANPTLGGVYLNRSLALRALGRYGEALADVDAALRLGQKVDPAYRVELQQRAGGGGR